MFCAQYGNAQSYYGNIRLGFYNPPTYTWGAWIRPGHYQPPLTEEEERVVDQRHGATPQPIPATPKSEPQVDNTPILLRLQHSAKMQEIANYKYERPHTASAPRRRDDDDEDYFILM